AIEKRLGPIPCGVEADRPPKRTSPPKTEAEDHPGQPGREQPDGRLARVIAVPEAKKNRKNDGRGPEAQCFAMSRLERPLVESGQAARQRELKVAASKVLLSQGN